MSNQDTTNSPCAWKEDEDGNWHTDCGELFVLIDGTPHENHYKFCPQCGGSLFAHVYEAPPVPEEPRG